MIFKNNGQTSCIMMPTWKDEFIIHRDKKTSGKYIIKGIDGVTYLFLPWLSGDVTIRGMKPEYYVLKKAP